MRVVSLNRAKPTTFFPDAGASKVNGMVPHDKHSLPREEDWVINDPSRRIPGSSEPLQSILNGAAEDDGRPA